MTRHPGELHEFLSDLSANNTEFHDAVLSILTAVLMDKEASDYGNFLDIIDLIEKKRMAAHNACNHRLRDALTTLGTYVRQEMTASALSFHATLKQTTDASFHQADTKILSKLGIGSGYKIFIGCPEGVNLLELSEQYMAAKQDLAFLSTHFRGRFLPLVSSIADIKKEAGKQLYDVAWMASSRIAGRSETSDLAEFRISFQSKDRLLLSTARESLNRIAIPCTSPWPADVIRLIEDWVCQYGSTATRMLHDLYSKHGRPFLEVLAFSGSIACLEALCRLNIKPDQKDVIFLLTLLRFGDRNVNTIAEWQDWLEKEITGVMHRKEAVQYFEDHPALIADLLTNLTIPNTLVMAWQKQIKEVDKEAFLNRRQSLMTHEMCQDVKAAFSALDHPLPDTETEQVNMPGVGEADAGIQEQPEPVDDTGKDVHRVIEGVMDAGVDAVMGDDLLEAGLSALADQGLGALGRKLTVTIEAQEEKTPDDAEPFIESESEKSIWYDYVKPLIYKNLFFMGVSGAIFSGLLILVFALWDRNAAIRYGLTPFLVVGVSFALTRIGSWLTRIDIESDTPVTILQSVSIFLAPLSLLFVGLLAVDSGLSGLVRVLWGVALSSVLLVSWYVIIMFSVKLVSRNIYQTHTRTLLFLNALLLLLPAAQLAVKYGKTELLVGAKMILIIGFYAGFTALIASSNRILNAMKISGERETSSRLVFFCVTSLGTFALVWGLTHARLGILPSVYTYGPLLILCAFFFSLVDFKTLDQHDINGRTSPLTFLTYFLIVLGILLSVSHSVVRSISLFMAGAVWFYIGLKLREEKHFGIAMVIFILSFTSLIMIKGVPDFMLPVSGIFIAAGLYGISLKTSIKELSDPAGRLCNIFLVIMFIVTIMWHWINPFPAFFCGISFLCYGFFLIYLGTQKDTLLHIHTGAIYLVAAVPYLGFADMQAYTLDENSLVFGLGLLALGWTVFSSTSGNTAIQDSRSTVLWGICMFAFSIMGLNFFIAQPPIASQGMGFRIMTLTGPTMIGGLLFFTGYFTRSFVPVYTGLVVMALMVPEVKAQFGISMYSGLGKTFLGMGLLAGIPFLKRWPVLNSSDSGDMIWRKKPFPYQMNDHQLFTTPMAVSALIVLSLVLFYNYPRNWFFSIKPFKYKTALAVVFSGVAFHYFSARFKNPLPSYIGYAAILFGMVHLYLTLWVYDMSSGFWPFFLLAAILMWEGVGKVFSRLFDETRTGFILEPLGVVKFIVIWAAAVFLYVLYSESRGSYFFWIPLFLYIGFLAARDCMNQKSRLMLIPIYLLIWQTVTLIFTSGMAFDDLLSRQSHFSLITALMVLVIATSFFYLERCLSEKDFKYYAHMLLISLVPAACFSLLILAGLGASFPDFQLFIWMVVMFIIGRYLNLSPLWLIGVLYFSLLILPGLAGFRKQFDIYIHPFTLVIMTAVLALGVQLSKRYPDIYRHRYAWPWAEEKILVPSFFLSSTGQVFIVIAMCLAIFDRSHVFSWCAASALFAGAVTEIPLARALSFSRRYLFFLLYTVAWIYMILLLKHHHPEHLLFFRFSRIQLAGFGFALSLITALGVDRFIRNPDHRYETLKYAIALCILGLGWYAYFSSGLITQKAVSYLTATGLLMLGAALFFRFFVHDHQTSSNYTLFAGSLFIGLISLGTAVFKGIAGHGPGAEAVYMIISIPCFWFYGRSEIRRIREKTYTPSRITATALLFVLAAIYIYPDLSELLLFSSPGMTLAAYRNNAVVAIAAGLVLIRLHTLGAGSYVVFSGFGFMALAVFFLLSQFMPAGALPYEIQYALILATVLSMGILSIVQTENPLKKALSWLGSIDADLWQRIRNFLFSCSLTASHVLLGISLFFSTTPSRQSIAFLMSAGLWIFTAHHYQRFLISYFGFIMILMAVFAKPALFFYGHAFVLPVPWMLLALFVVMIPWYIDYVSQKFNHSEIHYHIQTAVIAGLIVFESVSYFRSVSTEMMTFMILWGVSIMLIPVSASYESRTGFKVFLGFLLYFPVAFLFLLQALLPSEFTIKIFLAAAAMSCFTLVYRSWLKPGRIDARAGILRVYHHVHHYLTNQTSWSLVILQGVWTIATVILLCLSYKSYYSNESLMPFLLTVHAGIWIFLGSRHHKPGFNHIAFGLVVAALYSFGSSRVINQHLFLAQAFIFLYVLLLLFHLGYLKKKTQNAESFTHLWAGITGGLVLTAYMRSFNPYTYASLIIPMLLWPLILATPCSDKYGKRLIFRIFLGIMCYVPAYGVYIFRASPDFTAFIHAVLAIVLIAFVIKYQGTGRIKIPEHLLNRRGKRHIADHMYDYIRKPDNGLTMVPQISATSCLFAIHGAFYLFNQYPAGNNFLSMVILHTVLGMYWFRLARERQFWFWTVTAQLVFFGLILTIRSALPDMLGFEWTDNLDVMAGLVIAFTITAAKPLLQGQVDAVQKPIRFTLFSLPIATAIYAFTYDVSFQVIANAVLLYSILFTMKSYNEKDRLVLAYSFLGYNAYLVIMFIHYKINSFQAYLTPVCLSVLLLTQVFRDITSRNTANIVRGLALLVLLGTAMVQVITDSLMSPHSHLILLSLSIVAMVTARFLRIKIFAIAGFISFMIDIISVVYIVLIHRDAETLKIILGLSLTLGGGICLTGYILYRKNKDRIDHVLTKFRTTFNSWE